MKKYQAAGYINEVLTKKSLRDIIHGILKKTSVPETADFLDEIKTQGYKFAFQGGLSFSLGDIIIPPEKQGMIDAANKKLMVLWVTIIWDLLPTTNVITKLLIFGLLQMLN